MKLVGRKFWIFDMDGTLTVPAHDFDAIRDALGLPQGRPILEQLAELPRERARDLRDQLEQIELEIARRARPHRGAPELLAHLIEAGAVLGIVTRNTHRNALETLKTCGLSVHFDPRNILGRESCDPKPSADGIRTLLGFWHANPEEAVMVGDYRFDIESGKEAGTATICIDADGTKEWAELADRVVRDLDELRALLIRGKDAAGEQASH